MDQLSTFKEAAPEEKISPIPLHNMRRVALYRLAAKRGLIPAVKEGDKPRPMPTKDQLLVMLEGATALNLDGEQRAAAEQYIAEAKANLDAREEALARREAALAEAEAKAKAGEKATDAALTDAKRDPFAEPGEKDDGGNKYTFADFESEGNVPTLRKMMKEQFDVTLPAKATKATILDEAARLYAEAE